jgi:hypothetical protein
MSDIVVSLLSPVLWIRVDFRPTSGFPQPAPRNCCVYPGGQGCLAGLPPNHTKLVLGATRKTDDLGTSKDEELCCSDPIS